MGYRELEDAVNRKLQQSRQDNNAKLVILLLEKFDGFIDIAKDGVEINEILDSILKNNSYSWFMKQPSSLEINGLFSQRNKRAY